MLRYLAYLAAKRGCPALVSRHGQVNIDTEELVAFATRLSQNASRDGAVPHEPLIFALDTEHYNNPSARLLPKIMSGHGRKSVILQAVVAENVEEWTEGQRQTWIMEKPLSRAATDNEIERIEASLRSLVAERRLDWEVPSLNHWREYERDSTEKSTQPKSLFWVALRFFLTYSAELSTIAPIREALRQWIGRRIN